MSLLKEIGAILGFVAFGGMAVLAFLTFQQARHVRRLRGWAGRSPERAAVESERVSGSAGEATIARSGGLGEDERDIEKGPGRIHRLRGEVAYRWEEFDRRSPVDAKILLAAAAAVLIGAGIVTSGFGLLGGAGGGSPDSTSAAESKAEAKPTKVAVLNGTAPVEGGVGVPGVADTASKFVEDAGFTVGTTDNGPSLPASVVMFDGGDAEADASTLADSLQDQLGETEVVEMTPEVKDVAGKAKIALVVGADDGGI